MKKRAAGCKLGAAFLLLQLSGQKIKPQKGVGNRMSFILLAAWENVGHLKAGGLENGLWQCSLWIMKNVNVMYWMNAWRERPWQSLSWQRTKVHPDTLSTCSGTGHLAVSLVPSRQIVLLSAMKQTVCCDEKEEVSNSEMP